MTKRSKWLYILGTLFLLVMCTVMVCSAVMGARYLRQKYQNEGITIELPFDAPDWFKDWLQGLLDDIEIGGGGGVSGSMLEDWAESLPEDWLDNLPDQMPGDWPDEFPEDWFENLPDLSGESSVPGWFEDWVESLPGDITENLPENWEDFLPEDWIEQLPDEMPEDWPTEWPDDFPSLPGMGGGSVPGWFEDWAESLPGDWFEGDTPQDWIENLPEDWIEQLPDEMPEDWPSDLPNDWPEEWPDLPSGSSGGGNPGGGNSGENTDVYPGGNPGGNSDETIFGGNLIENGMIGMPEMGDSDGNNSGMLIMMTVQSDISEKVYLRYKSFGNYDGTVWGQAQEYTGSEYSMNYLPAFSLSGMGMTEHEMQITVYGSQYYLPYNIVLGSGNHAVQGSDVIYSGSTAAPYSLTYYSYHFQEDGMLSYTLSGNAAQAERVYRNFVYENYLYVPSSTAEYLRQVIAEQGFDKTDANFIADVAQFVQNAAAYNLKYDRSLDQQEDIVVSFLRDYKEGICQHYASAATLLFRTLGIPARYTIGIAGNVRAGEYASFTAANAHAWVEVYLDGFGWVSLEVTGQGGIPGGEGPGSAGDDHGEEIVAQPIAVQSESVVKEYDGTALRGEAIFVTDGALLPGHRISASGFAELVTVGKVTNTFTSITVFDENGKDVTYLYYITKEFGTLEVRPRAITITTGSATASYESLQGGALTCEDFTQTGLLSEHQIEVYFSGWQQYPGKSENSVSFVVIYDRQGNDVTDCYAVELIYGTLRVT